MQFKAFVAVLAVIIDHNCKMQILCDIHGDISNVFANEKHVNAETEDDMQSQHIPHLSTKNWSPSLFPLSRLIDVAVPGNMSMCYF